MGKRKPVYDPSHEAEMLESPVRMDGVGESQLVKDLLSPEFVTMPDTKAAPIAMALAELLTGMKMQASQQAKLMERFDKIEQAQIAWEKDKAKFLEDVDKRAASLLTTNPAQLDKYKAEWMRTAEEARINAQAQMAVGQMMFKQQMETEPKEIIMSPGIIETHREGDQLVNYVVPEIIAIKSMKWSLTPGVPVEVPHTVAVRFREIQRMRESLQERKNLLKDGVQNATVVATGWNAINKKYNTGGEDMTVPSA